MNTVFLGLRTRNLGTHSRQVTNPFTGDAFAVYTDAGMTPDEIEASSNLLTEFKASEADPDGFRKITFAGGNYIDVDLGRVAAEINVEGELTVDVVGFVFQLALASGMLVCSTVDPAAVAVLPGQQHPGICARWPKAAHVESVDELMVWIKNGIAQGHIAG